MNEVGPNSFMRTQSWVEDAPVGRANFARLALKRELRQIVRLHRWHPSEQLVLRGGLKWSPEQDGFVRYWKSTWHCRQPFFRYWTIQYSLNIELHENARFQRLSSRS